MSVSAVQPGAVQVPPRRPELSRAALAASRLDGRTLPAATASSETPTSARLGARSALARAVASSEPKAGRVGGHRALAAVGHAARSWSGRLAARLGPAAAGAEPPGGAFAEALRAAATRSVGGDGAPPAPPELRDAASQLVASTFIVPVLQSLRESPFNDGPLAPGAAERRFMPLLDQHIADRVTRASGFDLVDVIVRRLSRDAATGGSA